MIFPSTFSIVAHDPSEPAWGIAVASKFLAAGAVVPWARAGAGAVATQSHANTSFGPLGLDLMENGLSAQEVLDILIQADSERALRQVGLVDRQGRAATFTGQSCYHWAGGLTGEGFAVQGNILVGADVVHAMADTFTKSMAGLPRRLYQALLAGDQAGGDRRGRQSAAILVVKPAGGYGGLNDRWVDYRVDDHPDPVHRLGEILELHELYFDHSPESDQLQLEGDLLRKVQSLLSRLGYYQGQINGNYDAATQSAFRSFIGNENFEERTDFENGRIDRPVLDYLFRHFGETQ